MDRRHFNFVAVALLALLSTMLMPRVSSAEQGTSALKIRAFYCPGGVPVKGPILDCDPQSGIAYWTDQTNGKSLGGSGTLTFSHLAGSHITVYQAGGPTLDHIYCGFTNSDVFAQVLTDANSFQAPLESGRTSVCSIYSNEAATDDPLSASLTIHARACPDGAPVSDIFAECHGHPFKTDTKFGVDARTSKSLNASGNVAFHGLPGGDHWLSVSGPSGNRAYVRIFCAGIGEISAPVIHLDAGQSLTCDYYVIHG